MCRAVIRRIAPVHMPVCKLFPRPLSVTLGKRRAGWSAVGGDDDIPVRFVGEVGDVSYM